MDGSLEQVKSPTPQTVDVVGSFAPAGAADPTDIRGEGFTVEYLGVGSYRITLLGRYASLVCATGNMQLAAPLARSVIFDDEVIGLTATCTLRLQVVDKTDAPVETAANANNRVHFRLALCNTINPGF